MINMSTQTTHTPGPWHYMPGYPAIVSELVDIPADPEQGTAAIPVKVVDLCGAMGGEDTTADAQLIAAAPELLQALQELQKELRAVVKLDVKKHFSLMLADAAANKAIAKATGQL